MRNYCLIGLLGLRLILASDPVFAKSLQVIGWPDSFTSLTTPDHKWAGDPVLGVLSCPALTRMNLLSKSSSPWLASAVDVQQDGKLWRIQLSKPMSWWSGEAVTVQNIADFLRRELAVTVSSYSKGQWVMPAFKLRAVGKSLELAWQQAPVFGPFILNRMPLWRPLAEPRAGVGFECVGPYRLGHDLKALSFLPTNPRDLAVTFLKPPIDPGSRPTLAFRFASSFANTVAVRYPDQAIPCKRRVDFPLFSALLWNPESVYGRQHAVRQAVAHLVPRQLLQNSGAGYLGIMVAGPLLKVHPGYQKNLKPKYRDIEKALQGLKAAGYASDTDGILHREGQSLELSIATLAGQASLVRGLVGDFLKEAGIGVRWLPIEQAQDADVTLGGYKVAWPSGDLMELGWHWAAEPGMKEKLLAYRRSVTIGKPDFAILRQIFGWVYQQELVTVLLQHKACLELNTGQGIGRIIMRNPDWFRDMIDAMGERKL